MQGYLIQLNEEEEQMHKTLQQNKKSQVIGSSQVRPTVVVENAEKTGSSITLNQNLQREQTSRQTKFLTVRIDEGNGGAST